MDVPLREVPSEERRVDYRLAVDLLLNKYVDGRPHVARASSISRRGLRVHRVFEPRTPIDSVGLQFQLPDTDLVITCAGRIVEGDERSESQGIVFTNVSIEHQKVLDDFIGARLRWP